MQEQNEQQQQPNQIQQEKQNEEMIEEPNQEEAIDLQNQNEEFSDDFKSDDEDAGEHRQLSNHDKVEIQSIPKVSNPVSAYSMFIREFKQKHPNEKMGLSQMAEVWKELDEAQKQIYVKKFVQQRQRFQQYEAQMLAIDPDYFKKSKSANNYFFPLYKVKAIMKQDPNFTVSKDNVGAMAKATEYFGQYLLEEVKKIMKDKKRVEVSHFFDAINNNQSNLWFLNCLIDEHNMENGITTKQAEPQQIKKTKAPLVVQRHQREIKQIPQKTSVSKIQKKSSKKPKTTEIPKGQMKLTDMF